MDRNVDALLYEAHIARESGQYVKALSIAQQVMKQVIASFGNQSLEAAMVGFFTAETIFLDYQQTIPQENKIHYGLRNASIHILIVLSMLEEANNCQTLLYLKANLLAGCIFLTDDNNTIPCEDHGWEVNTPRKTIVEMGKIKLYKVIRYGIKFIENNIAKEEIEIEKTISQAYEELLKWLPEDKNRQKFREFYHHIEGAGWLKVYRDHSTGEEVFDAKSLCELLDLSVKQVEKIIGEDILYI